MSLYHTLEALASLGRAVKVSTLAKMAGFRGANSPEFRRHLAELRKQKMIEVIQSGWRSEKRGDNKHYRVVILKTDVWRLQGEVELEPKQDQDVMALNTENKKESIQRIINKRSCSKCPDFQKEGNVGFCKKYGWEISLDLAERQTLCFF